MTMAERIKAARINAGVSQAGLAKNAGIQQSMISRYESGETEPTITSLLKLAEALGVKVDDLLGGK